MGPVVPFIPTIAGAIGGLIGGEKTNPAPTKRAPAEGTPVAGGQGAGTALASQGAGLYGQGTGMVQQGQQTLAQPTSYYQKLLSGNRALASQAVSAPRGAISDVYRGASRNLEQGGGR